MKRVLSFLMIALLLAAPALFAGCVKYSSHFSATTLVTTNTPSSSSMRFGSFEGERVLTLKCKSEPKTLKYSAELKKGSAIVWIDFDGEKTELFSIDAGEKVEAEFEGLKKGKVYIIVQTKEKCSDGNFRFDLK